MMPLNNYLLIAFYFVLSLPFQSIASTPNGEVLYDMKCSVCHGLKGEGGVGVPLSLPGFINSISNEYIFKTIRYGRPGRVMPAFNDLSDIQINAITHFIRSWGTVDAIEESDERIKGDKKHGEKLFHKNCMQCHGENGRGGQGTGVTYSRQRNSPIIAPALNNTGFLLSASDAMIRDVIKYGRIGTPMSSQLHKGLSVDDINDLVAYIRSFDISVRKEDLISDKSSVISIDSPYSIQETIDNLKQSIADQNFTLIRVEPLNTGLVKPGEEDKTQMVIHFCNFNFLFEALSIDPRVGLFLPCRITVIEDKGKVKVMAINPLILSALFNNDELDNACKKMYKIYNEIIKDAVL